MNLYPLSSINFSLLIDIVNAIDGITVYSDYAFTTVDGYTFVKGKNEMNGKEALSFSRERKAFTDGDRQRGKNQQKVLEAILNKAMSASIITKYSSLLSSLNGKFITNLDTKELTNFIKKQISDMPKWSYTTNSLDGTDGYDYTYSYKNSKLYVMIPDEKSVANATKLINEALK